MQCSIITSIPHTPPENKTNAFSSKKIEHIMNNRNGVTIKIRCFAKFKSQLKAWCLYWWLLVATGYWCWWLTFNETSPSQCTQETNSPGREAKLAPGHCRSQVTCKLLTAILWTLMNRPLTPVIIGSPSQIMVSLEHHGENISIVHFGQNMSEM